MSRTFKHWTPRYIYNRISLFIWEKSNPKLPWLTKDSIYIIENLISKKDNMLEFGAGRSTVWFSTRVNRLTSVETDKQWYVNVSKETKNLGQIEILHITKENEFINFIKQLEDKSLDIVLIDGAYRETCANYILKKMKSNGLIVIDNANWFLYNPVTHSPNSLKSHAEMSVSWKDFYSKTIGYRRIWTTSGVTDTLILISK
jgi:predicted O-methyltransferase YrrM